MRIGIDARPLLEPYPSGVSVYTAELLLALLALPERQDTLCLFTAGWTVPTDRLKPFLNYPHVEWQHLNIPNKLFALHLAPKLDRVLGKVDVLFTPNWNFTPVSRACPVVLTVHDCAIALYPQLLSRKQKLWHTLIRPKAQLRRARSLIAVSDTTRTDVIAHYQFPADRITTIHSAAPTPVEPITVPGLPDKYVVVIGTGERRKNLAAIQAAHIHLPIIRVGDHTGPYGYLSAGEKWYVLQHAQALVYISLYEGFGFPPLEAFQAGVPVVASCAGAIPEICGSAALYVNPYSSSDVTNAVNTVIADQTVRAQLIAAGTAQLKLFNWQTAARATLQVLHQAVY
ncbi:MAG: glycosyltransferase family 4 protein [Candidatus Kerfeldbacteria bacterium]|nr:glycosyltransferase family 4 protein [Candidatus Kerfeldbacteria bacterium]